MTVFRYVLILALVLFPASSFATTFPVTKTADTDDGTCDSDCSLREAIEAANTNPGSDDVPVPAGTYLLTLGQLTVSDDVSIAGAGQENTIVDGNAGSLLYHRVFEIQASATADVSGITIQNGSTFIQRSRDPNPLLYPGGGIANYGGNLTLSNSTVRNNTAGTAGGAIYSLNGILTLTSSTVSNNEAVGGPLFEGRGGGISSHRDYDLPYQDPSGDLTLTNSTVSGNTAPLGGGIDNDGGVLTIINSTVSNNIAALGGGGIYNWNSELAALYPRFTSTITNSTISGNTVDLQQFSIGGGGILSAGPSGLNGPGTFYFENSIVAGNYAANPGDPYANCMISTISAVGHTLTSLGHNLTDDDSCGFTAPSDLLVADAMLGPLQDNGGPTETHDLLPGSVAMPGSPAIDAGDNVNCPATDQRGVARPQGAACDIGAVEYLPEPGSSLALIAGAAFIGLLYRRRVRGSQLR